MVKDQLKLQVSIHAKVKRKNVGNGGSVLTAYRRLGQPQYTATVHSQATAKPQPCVRNPNANVQLESSLTVQTVPLPLFANALLDGHLSLSHFSQSFHSSLTSFLHSHAFAIPRIGLRLHLEGATVLCPQCQLVQTNNLIIVGSLPGRSCWQSTAS